MNKHNQNGAAGGLTLAFIVTFMLLIGAICFAAWAFTGRQDYKNNTDAKINTAVQAAVQKESAAKDAAAAAAAADPLATYSGPEAYGSIIINYPKNWSGYVDNTNSSTPLNAYFTPGVVPALSAQTSVFALRVQVLNQAYAQVLQGITGQQKLSVSAYALPKLPNVVGVKAVGQISDQVNGTMVILPLRANTLEIWTDGTQYMNDFNNNILANFSFSP